MTPVFRCVLILVSFCTLFGIVKKVRNAKIQIENTIFWIIFGFLLLLLSIFPQIASFAADILGIYSTTNFIFLFIIYSLISFCPVVSPALIKEPRRERTLTKKQTVCQKEIIRMHDIISAKKTVLINKHC